MNVREAAEALLASADPVESRDVYARVGSERYVVPGKRLASLRAALCKTERESLEPLQARIKRAILHIRDLEDILLEVESCASCPECTEMCRRVLGDNLADDLHRQPTT